MNWKTVALIFIILFLAENVLFGVLLTIGRQEIKRESECSFICRGFEGDAQLYQDGFCECYYKGDLIHKEEIK